MKSKTGEKANFKRDSRLDLPGLTLGAGERHSNLRNPTVGGWDPASSKACVQIPRTCTEKQGVGMLSLQSQECAHKRNTSSEEQQESGDLKRPQARMEGYKESVARADWWGTGRQVCRAGAEAPGPGAAYLVCLFATLEGVGRELESSRSRRETEQKTFTSSRSDPSERLKRA